MIETKEETMDNNWAENRSQLDRILELEHALARQRRQQQWQHFVYHCKRLHTFLTHAWSWRQQRALAPHS